MSRVASYCIIIGAMKAGTTSLFHALARCDGMNASRVKDTRFFVSPKDDGTWNRGRKWYESQFERGAGLRLEASTQYAKWPDKRGVPERIRQSIDDPWIVYAIRQPVERALSHYFHNLVADGVWVDINRALADESGKYYSYSDYALQLRRYLAVFPAGRILFTEPTRDLNEQIPRGAGLWRLGLPGQPLLDENRNSLAENLARRGDPPKGSPAHRRGLELLRRLVREDTRVDIRTLALEFGLRRGVCRKLERTLRERSREFSRLTGVRVDHWWDR